MTCFYDMVTDAQLQTARSVTASGDACMLVCALAGRALGHFVHTWHSLRESATADPRVGGLTKEARSVAPLLALAAVLPPASTSAISQDAHLALRRWVAGGAGIVPPASPRKGSILKESGSASPNRHRVVEVRSGALDTAALLSWILADGPAPPLGAALSDFVREAAAAAAAPVTVQEHAWVVLIAACVLHVVAGQVWRAAAAAVLEQGADAIQPTHVVRGLLWGKLLHGKAGDASLGCHMAGSRRSSVPNVSTRGGALAALREAAGSSHTATALGLVLLWDHPGGTAHVLHRWELARVRHAALRIAAASPALLPPQWKVWLGAVGRVASGIVRVPVLLSSPAPYAPLPAFPTTAASDLALWLRCVLPATLTRHKASLPPGQGSLEPNHALVAKRPAAHGAAKPPPPQGKVAASGSPGAVPAASGLPVLLQQGVDGEVLGRVSVLWRRLHFVTALAQAGAGEASASGSGLAELAASQPRSVWEGLASEVGVELAEQLRGEVEALSGRGGDTVAALCTAAGVGCVSGSADRALTAAVQAALPALAGCMEVQALRVLPWSLRGALGADAEQVPPIGLDIEARHRDSVPCDATVNPALSALTLALQGSTMPGGAVAPHQVSSPAAPPHLASMLQVLWGGGPPPNPEQLHVELLGVAGLQEHLTPEAVGAVEAAAAAQAAADADSGRAKSGSLYGRIKRSIFGRKQSSDAPAADSAPSTLPAPPPPAQRSAGSRPRRTGAGAGRGKSPAHQRHLASLARALLSTERARREAQAAALLAGVKGPGATASLPPDPAWLWWAHLMPRPLATPPSALPGYCVGLPADALTTAQVQPLQASPFLLPVLGSGRYRALQLVLAAHMPPLERLVAEAVALHCEEDVPFACGGCGQWVHLAAAVQRTLTGLPPSGVGHLLPFLNVQEAFPALAAAPPSAAEAGPPPLPQLCTAFMCHMLPLIAATQSVSGGAAGVTLQRMQELQRVWGEVAGAWMVQEGWVEAPAAAGRRVPPPAPPSDSPALTLACLLCMAVQGGQAQSTLDVNGATSPEQEVALAKAGTLGSTALGSFAWAVSPLLQWVWGTVCAPPRHRQWRRFGLGDFTEDTAPLALAARSGAPEPPAPLPWPLLATLHGKAAAPPSTSSVKQLLGEVPLPSSQASRVAKLTTMLGSEAEGAAREASWSEEGAGRTRRPSASKAAAMLGIGEPSPDTAEPPPSPTRSVLRRFSLTRRAATPEPASHVTERKRGGGGSARRLSLKAAALLGHPSAASGSSGEGGLTATAATRAGGSAGGGRGTGSLRSDGSGGVEEQSPVQLTDAPGFVPPSPSHEPDPAGLRNRSISGHSLASGGEYVCVERTPPKPTLPAPVGQWLAGLLQRMLPHASAADLGLGSGPKAPGGLPAADQRMQLTACIGSASHVWWRDAAECTPSSIVPALQQALEALQPAALRHTLRCVQEWEGDIPALLAATAEAPDVPLATSGGAAGQAGDGDSSADENAGAVDTAFQDRCLRGIPAAPTLPLLAFKVLCQAPPPPLRSTVPHLPGGAGWQMPQGALLFSTALDPHRPTDNILLLSAGDGPPTCTSEAGAQLSLWQQWQLARLTSLVRSGLLLTPQLVPGTGGHFAAHVSAAAGLLTAPFPDNPTGNAIAAWLTAAGAGAAEALGQAAGTARDGSGWAADLTAAAAAGLTDGLALTGDSTAITPQQLLVPPQQGYATELSQAVCRVGSTPPPVQRGLVRAIASWAEGAASLRVGTVHLTQWLAVRAQLWGAAVGDDGPLSATAVALGGLTSRGPTLASHRAERLLTTLHSHCDMAAQHLAPAPPAPLAAGILTPPSGDTLTPLAVAQGKPLASLPPSALPFLAQHTFGPKSLPAAQQPDLLPAVPRAARVGGGPAPPSKAAARGRPPGSAKPGSRAPPPGMPKGAAPKPPSAQPSAPPGTSDSSPATSPELTAAADAVQWLAAVGGQPLDVAAPAVWQAHRVQLTELFHAVAADAPLHHALTDVWAQVGSFEAAAAASDGAAPPLLIHTTVGGSVTAEALAEGMASASAVAPSSAGASPGGGGPTPPSPSPAVLRKSLTRRQAQADAVAAKLLQRDGCVACWMAPGTGEGSAGTLVLTRDLTHVPPPPPKPGRASGSATSPKGTRASTLQLGQLAVGVCVEDAWSAKPPPGLAGTLRVALESQQQGEGAGGCGAFLPSIGAAFARAASACQRVTVVEAAGVACDELGREEGVLHVVAGAPRTSHGDALWSHPLDAVTQLVGAGGPAGKATSEGAPAATLAVLVEPQAVLALQRALQARLVSVLDLAARGAASAGAGLAEGVTITPRLLHAAIVCGQ